jgi:two-component system, cell cycle sensor histidine kinase and response regulator CckA
MHTPLPRSLPASAPDRPILVVDDEADVRAVVARLLEHIGFPVLLAGSGSEGLTCFQQHAATLYCVLLNLWMPQMNGASVFREMQRINPHVPIILMSGYLAADMRYECRGQNLAGTLEKPFTLNELRSRIQAVCVDRGRVVGH